MRVEHRLLVLGVMLAGAITGAMSVQFGGFVNSHIRAGEATASDADQRQEAGPRYELTATSPAREHDRVEHLTFIPPAQTR